MTDEKKASSTTIKVMLVIIAMMIIGIITRWDFIRSEVVTVFHNLFPKTENTQ